MDRGYVLHSYPYRETSLILQAWTEKHGRLGLVAKGARRPKSASRAVLVPFQPLALDWFGRGELRTLKTAEPMVAATPLAGEALMSAFYMNELLLKLTRATIRTSSSSPRTTGPSRSFERFHARAPHRRPRVSSRSFAASS